MRNIMQAEPVLNLRRRGGFIHSLFVAAIALPVLGLLAVGCADEPARETAIPADNTGLRPIVFDTSAMDAWLDLSDRLAAGEEVPATDFTALLALPEYAAYTTQKELKTFHPLQFEYGLRDLFSPAGADWAETAGVARNRIQTPKLLAQNFEYLKLRRAEIDSAIRRICRPGVMAGIFDRTAGYIPAEAWPDTLKIRFLVANPGTSILDDGVLLLDAGLALAAGPAELPAMIAAHYYANLMPMASPLAMDESGPAALAATLRQIRQEAVTAWLQRYPDVKLDSMHPAFTSPVEQQIRYFDFALGSLRRCDQMLTTLFYDPDIMLRRGDSLDDLLRINATYPALGYAMAEAVVKAAGEQSLRECSRDAAAFIAAYQEAVQPAWETATEEERLSLMPPFTPDNLLGMKNLLAEYPVGGTASATGQTED